MRLFLPFLFWFCAAFPLRAQTVQIPFQFTPDGHMIAPVYINGTGPHDFILDSAASRTVISTPLATKLNLPIMTDRVGRLMAAGGALDTDVYRLDSLLFGGQEWHLGPVLALPEVTSKQGYAGILGLDVLSSQVLYFDFKAQKVALISSRDAKRLRRAHKWHKIIAQQNFAGFLSVRMKIKGNPVIAIVDSGARRSVGNAKLGALLENLSPASIMVREQIITGVAMPQVPARLGRARVVDLQSLRWNEADLLVADLAVFDALNLNGQPALILGLDFLQSTSALMLDFSRQRIWIKP